MSTPTTIVDISQDPGLNYLSTPAVATVQQRQEKGLPAGNVIFNSVTEVRNVYIRQTTNVPGGSNGEVQFNNGNTFSGDPEFKYNPTTNQLEVDGTILVDGTITASSFRYPNGASVATVSTFSGDYNDLTNKPVISDTSTLSGGDFFIAQNESSVSLGQVAAQTITVGGSGIQIAGTGGVTIMGVATAEVNLGGQTSGNINFNSPTTGISYNHLADIPTIPTDINQLTDSEGVLGSTDRLVNSGKSLILGSDGNVDINGHLAIKKEGEYLSTVGKTSTFGSTILNTKLFVDYNEVGITSTIDVENMPDETATATVKVGAALATMLSTDDDAGDPATQYRGQLDVSYTGITLTLATPTTETSWVFDDNNLKLPAGGDIVDINGTSVLGGGGGASTGNITFTDTNLTSTNGDVTITFDQVASPAVVFSFTTTGEFITPQVVTGGVTTNQVDMYYTRQVSDNTNVTCPPNVDTVIHTGTDQWQHTFKLLLKVEGNEDPAQQGWDTQSCEMMIAKSYRNNTMAGSVYGLVYTSTNPLATFTTRWNASISRVEVLCRPTSTTENVVVRSFVTEMTSSD